MTMSLPDRQAAVMQRNSDIFLQVHCMEHMRPSDIRYVHVYSRLHDGTAAFA